MESSYTTGGHMIEVSRSGEVSVCEVTFMDRVLSRYTHERLYKSPTYMMLMVRYAPDSSNNILSQLVGPVWVWDRACCRDKPSTFGGGRW